MNTEAPRVGIVGLGYVGLPLAVTFAQAGVPVLGLEAIRSKVDDVNSGQSYIEDVPNDTLKPFASSPFG